VRGSSWLARRPVSDRVVRPDGRPGAGSTRVDNQAGALNPSDGEDRGNGD